MAGGRPKKNLPEDMPLSQRPSFVGHLAIFRKHAARFKIDILDIWGGVKGPPALARKAIALEMSDLGYGPKLIGWTLGWATAHTCRQVAKARAERGDVRTITAELGTKPEDVKDIPPPPEACDPVWGGKPEPDEDDNGRHDTDPAPKAADEEAHPAHAGPPTPLASPVASVAEPPDEGIGLSEPLDHERHDESVRLGRPATDEDILGIDPFEPLFADEQ